MPKDAFKQAYAAFLRRDFSTALSQLQVVFRSLPPAELESWGVELEPKTRSTEHRRAQAVALYITASTIHQQSISINHSSSSSGSLGSTGSSTIDPPQSIADSTSSQVFFNDLLARTRTLYTPSQPHDPGSSFDTIILPPSIVHTLSTSALSLRLPFETIRSLLEAWFTSLPPKLLESLALADELSEEDRSKDEPDWWLMEALEGYEELLARYLVEVLGQMAKERKEAERLLEWDGVLGSGRKQVSLASCF